eukprot:6184460-Pleurochrysis_carterae.AAC.1
MQRDAQAVAGRTLKRIGEPGTQQSRPSDTSSALMCNLPKLRAHMSNSMKELRIRGCSPRRKRVTQATSTRSEVYDDVTARRIQSCHSQTGNLFSANAEIGVTDGSNMQTGQRAEARAQQQKRGAGDYSFQTTAAGTSEHPPTLRKYSTAKAGHQSMTAPLCASTCPQSGLRADLRAPSWRRTHV